MSKIKVSKNGPYLVTDLPINEDIVEYDQEGVPLKTVSGKQISNKDCALCRCGHSKNKPFCDGTHATINFDGTENPEAKEEYDNQVEVLEGPELILKDAQHLCVGAGFCHRAGGVWSLIQNSDDPDAKKTAIEEACCCPSGRLVACDKKTGKAIEPKFDPSIGISEVGPLAVKGGVMIESADGSTYPIRNRVTLCRCGKSKNKPYCDGSHFE